MTWRCGEVLYISVVFTWMLSKAEKIARCHNNKVIAGGPAVQLMGADWADEVYPDTIFDVLAMHNPLATFTTRGCPRKCKYCIVPKIEGDLVELKSWKPAPIVCDNNILAASNKHFEKVIDSLLPFPYVDFNQGLDARLFTSYHADQLCRLKSVKMRFGFDHRNCEKYVYDAISTARKAGLKDSRLFGIYVLIGHDDNLEDALYRLEKVREWGIWPNPMRFQPLDTIVKNSYVADGWTDKNLRRVMRYYSRLRYFEHIPFKDYQGGEPEKTEQPVMI